MSISAQSWSKIEHIEADVLIVGGGIAGMMAAVGAVKHGAKPIVVTKAAYASGSSSMARAGHAIAIGHADPADNPDEFFQDAMRGGGGIGNPRLVEVLCRESIDRTLDLDAWGLGFVKLKDGRFDQKKMGFPHRYPRLVTVGRLMGKVLLAAVAKKTDELGIEPLEHVMLVDLLKQGQRVVGAWGLRYRTGTPIVIHAASTILATGGAPEIHTLNDSPPTITGDGYAMALRAGAELVDMEFIDYQLITAAPPKMVGYPPHATGFLNSGGYLINKDGERFMERYDPQNMERSARAMINRATAIEIFEGRGSENGAVYIDIRHVFDKANEGSCADVVKAFEKAGVDLRTSLLEVSSCPHTYLGGVKIDELGRASVAGLYAGGEAAGGVHGANRLDGAALIDSYVFGYRAGGAAAEDSKKLRVERGDSDDMVRSELERATNNDSAHLTVDEWRRAVQQLVFSCFGQVRRADRLSHGLERLDILDKQFDDVRIDGDTDRKRFDTLRRKLETRNLVQVARMLGTAALSRNESRGGHFRIDFPVPNDEKFLGNFVLKQSSQNLEYSFNRAPELTSIKVVESTVLSSPLVNS
jgi:fumarate reductase (CoM/CoB) subunit A